MILIVLLRRSRTHSIHGSMQLLYPMLTIYFYNIGIYYFIRRVYEPIHSTAQTQADIFYR